MGSNEAIGGGGGSTKKVPFVSRTPANTHGTMGERMRGKERLRSKGKGYECPPPPCTSFLSMCFECVSFFIASVGFWRKAPRDRKGMATAPPMSRSTGSTTSRPTPIHSAPGSATRPRPVGITRSTGRPRAASPPTRISPPPNLVTSFELEGEAIKLQADGGILVAFLCARFRDRGAVRVGFIGSALPSSRSSRRPVLCTSRFPSRPGIVSSFAGPSE